MGRACSPRVAHAATRALRPRPTGPTIQRSGSTRGSEGPVDESQVTVSCRGVWKVYGPKALSIVGSPDASLPRAELL
jgi:hypothetical protein